MKISELIKELEHVRESYGDIPVELQDDGAKYGTITGYRAFFIIPEQSSNNEGAPQDGWHCILRWWPY